MDDQSSNTPSIKRGFPFDYEIFETYIAHNLVRCIYDLKKLEKILSANGKHGVSKKLASIGRDLKPVVAFLADCDIFLDPEHSFWNKFEETYFQERDRRFPDDVFPLSLFSTICDMAPHEIAELLANTFSKYCAIVGSDESKTALDLLSYINNPEIRPMIHCTLLPVLQLDKQETAQGREEQFINNFYLASFGLCIANNLIIGGDLDSAEIMVATEGNINLESLLAALYDRLPNVAEHLDTIVFENQRKQAKPWPFTIAINKWLNQKVIANRSFPWDRLNAEGLSFVYLRNLNIPDRPLAEIRSEYRSPFDPPVVNSCDDEGKSGVGIAFYTPPLCTGPMISVPFGALEREYTSANRGLIQNVVLN
ncbi:MAG: hypothetical protein U0R17_04405 [Acidimicrobiia bacterium]